VWEKEEADKLAMYVMQRVRVALLRHEGICRRVVGQGTLLHVQIVLRDEATAEFRRGVRVEACSRRMQRGQKRQRREFRGILQRSRKQDLFESEEHST